METKIYTKENGNLKITTPKVEIVSLRDLKSDKIFLEKQLAEFTEYSTKTLLQMQSELDEVNKNLSEAGKLGVLEKAEAAQATIIN